MTVSTLKNDERDSSEPQQQEAIPGRRAPRDLGLAHSHTSIPLITHTFASE